MFAKVPRIVTSRRRTTAGASAASVSISVGPSFMLRESPVGVQLNWYYIGYRFPTKRYVAPIPVFTIHHLRRSPYRASDRQHGEEGRRSAAMGPSSEDRKSTRLNSSH